LKKRTQDLDVREVQTVFCQADISYRIRQIRLGLPFCAV
jgi:hypothetical protein